MYRFLSIHRDFVRSNQKIEHLCFLLTRLKIAGQGVGQGASELSCPGFSILEKEKTLGTRLTDRPAEKEGAKAGGRGNKVMLKVREMQRFSLNVCFLYCLISFH